jgi:hypothetical protein
MNCFKGYRTPTRSSNKNPLKFIRRQEEMQPKKIGARICFTKGERNPGMA